MNDKLKEQELYEWLLEQRLLAEVGELSYEKHSYLSNALPGWDFRVTDDDANHAITVDRPDLNQALEVWWNLSGLSSTPLTFHEIRAKRALEAQLSFERA